MNQPCPPELKNLDERRLLTLANDAMDLRDGARPAAMLQRVQLAIALVELADAVHYRAPEAPKAEP